ncbi:MAG TPA: SpoIIE family protein phosphatase [Thermoanaerobaculia bacterium]|nr:SpoIIE family protein phosphatase [Thermoanaerobaculia bacterium]
MTRSRKRTILVWAVALAIVIIVRQVEQGLSSFDRELPALSILSFFGWLVLLAISFYWITSAIRFVLRRLFWRVGSRLALSYFLTGVLPFALFAILMVFVSYLVAGVLSQTALRTEQHETLAKLDEHNLLYAIRGQTADDLPKSTKLYETSSLKKGELPSWLLTEPFSGMVAKGRETFFVSSKRYDTSSKRKQVVLVLPLAGEWVTALESKNGMMLALRRAEASHGRKKPKGIRVQGRKGGEWSTNAGEGFEIDDSDEDIGKFLRRAWSWGKVVWFDVSPPLVDWESGRTDSRIRLFTLISNPLSNLRDFYFTSSDYFNFFVGAIVATGGMLLMIYLFAAMFAAVLIFSISRAVNRIEKGTHAVERGDFSYRIKMRPHNQLGQMAQSFDRMTESIASLLTKVAEKERLQSEIDIAASIQRNLLPREGPRFRGVSFSAHFEPTAAVGGDYYDVFNLDETRLAVAIGDVSGHGLSTGLVMAMVKAAMTTLVEEGADEEAMFRRLNQLVHRSTEKRAFMSLGFTIFDLAKGTIRHTNAGHLYPYRLRKDTLPYAIESPSLPLGVRSTIQSHTVTDVLEEGDMMVYLSDGIIEAQDGLGDPFGFDKLESILSTLSHETPANVQTRILEAIALHAGDRPADDDRTVMVLRFDHMVVTSDDGPVSSVTAMV